MAPRKHETITFKVEPELAERMRAIPNRSEFIRGALIRALDVECPLCAGSGRLSPQQASHWTDHLAPTHPIEEAPDTRERVLVCRHAEPKKSPRRPAPKSRKKVSR